MILGKFHCIQSKPAASILAGEAQSESLFTTHTSHDDGGGGVSTIESEMLAPIVPASSC